MVGASNAKRCADALERGGFQVIRVIIPGWSCVKSKIPGMEDLLRRKLTEASEDCTVVFQFLDTTFYFTKRGDDGRFHVEGDSVLAPKKPVLHLQPGQAPAVTGRGPHEDPHQTSSEVF